MDFQTFVAQITSVAKSITPRDIIDMLLVAFIFYQGLRLVRETRAASLVKGILVMLTLYGISSAFKMKALTTLMGYIFTIGAYALLVVFQPELRRALEKIGRTRFSDWGLFNSDNDEDNLRWNIAIKAIGEASTYLSKRRIGALMVLERQTKLGEIIKTGTVVDSAPSAELLGNVFFPNSPLHDGALIIRQGRLYAAGCYLPLSDHYDISKEMGT
ncbi:MAG: diadenylate cyclase, partial [Oscillospiraceae bacterium]